MVGNEEMTAGREGYDSLDWTLGDLSLRSSYQLVAGDITRPAVVLDTRVKAPTARVAKNYATGKLNYGAGLILRKFLSRGPVLVDRGHLVLGHPDGIQLRTRVSTTLDLGEIIPEDGMFFYCIIRGVHGYLIGSRHGGDYHPGLYPERQKSCRIL